MGLSFNNRKAQPSPAWLSQNSSSGKVPQHNDGNSGTDPKMSENNNGYVMLSSVL